MTEIMFTLEDALAQFTEEEQSIMSAWYHDDSGEFIGIGFVCPRTGKVTKFADHRRSHATFVLQLHYIRDSGQEVAR